MKKKLLAGLAIAMFMFGMVGTTHAAYIIMDDIVTTQLGGVGEVDIDGTLWDATFYNQWSLTPNKEAYGAFAATASAALRDVFHTYEPLREYGLNPQRIWGIENIGMGSLLFTPSFAAFVDSYPDYWWKSGSAYSVGGSIANVRGQTHDQARTISFVQWSLSPVDPDPGSAPVPEPTTILLLSTGLMGLAGFGRKKFLKK